tara:strand:- start:592 stop:1056 length:465 start_codon:yes stop_codon:yes gene_type:complete
MQQIPIGTDATFWRRLAKRLDLDALIGGKATVPNIVLPVTNIEPLLQDLSRDYVSGLDLSASAGTFVQAFVVDPGEIWTLIGWSTSTTVASSQLMIRDTQSQAYPLTIALTAINIEYLANIPLPEGWEIGRTTTGNAGDSNESLFILVKKETAY